MAFASTKQVYYTSPEQVVHIIPAESILGSLALVPVGEHGIITLSVTHLPLNKASVTNGVGLAQEASSSI